MTREANSPVWGQGKSLASLPERKQMDLRSVLNLSDIKEVFAQKIWAMQKHENSHGEESSNWFIDIIKT